MKVRNPERRSVPFSDVLLQSLKAEHPTYFWDIKVPAFGIYVGRRRKTFVVIQNGGRRRKIGRYPLLSLADARKLALSILYAGEPRSEVESINGKEAVELFMRTHHRTSKPSHQREQQRLLDKYFVPIHGGSPLSRVTTQHILKLTDALARAPSEQLHLHRALKTFFGWAVTRAYVLSSPLDRLTPPAKQTSRDRVLSDPELLQVWNLAASFPYPFGPVVQLLILTGQRYSEIANLRRSYVATDLITWPKEATKNNSEHRIPITPKVAGILASLPRGASDRLFPVFSASIATRNFKRRLMELPPWTLHDLRRTFSTNQARLGTPPDVTEAILNHKTGSRSPIQRIYDRYDRLEPMRRALFAYDAFLVALSPSTSMTRDVSS
jgi:integrase